MFTYLIAIIFKVINHSPYSFSCISWLMSIGVCTDYHTYGRTSQTFTLEHIFQTNYTHSTAIAPIDTLLSTNSKSLKLHIIKFISFQFFTQMGLASNSHALVDYQAEPEGCQDRCSTVIDLHFCPFAIEIPHCDFLPWIACSSDCRYMYFVLLARMPVPANLSFPNPATIIWISRGFICKEDSTI